MKKVKLQKVIQCLCLLSSNVAGTSLSYRVQKLKIPDNIIGICKYSQMNTGKIISTTQSNKNTIGTPNDLMSENLSKKHAPNKNQNMPYIGNTGM